MNESRLVVRHSPCWPALLGFTLVEVMVSMTVLILLFVMVFAMVNRASTLITFSNKHIDSDNEARTVFDRMAFDFAGMIRRPDVDCVFAKNDGNDTMYFYSHAPGYFSGSETSSTNNSANALVGYRVPYGRTGSAAYIQGNYVLERVGRGVLWENGNRTATTVLPYLTYPPATTANPTPTPFPATTMPVAFDSFLGPAPRFDSPTQLGWTNLISNAVFRLEFCFLRKDGSYYTPVSASADSGGGADFMNAMRRVPTDVVGIVVAIAVLDKQSRALLPDPSVLQQVVAALPDYVGDTAGTTTPPQLMLETWTLAINRNNFASASHLPVAAAAQVRVYQRTFYLNAY